jgi:lipopolysaccharide/colanic/teichoic acid biosynthesis glycosyltransferase
MIKRWCDLAIAGTGLLLVSPVLALAAAAIRLSSRGPVLYVQERIGRGGRPFRLYKLRTMVRAASGAQVTAANDARVTGVGRLLRRTKIDELPQLWNVVRGDMTLIGPRPEVERYVRQYNAEQRQILEYVPGLASVAQLMYPQEPDLLRTAANPEAFYVRQLLPRKVAADLAYERGRTVWSDLRLIGDIVLLVAGRHSRMDRSLTNAPGGLPNER